MRDVLAALQSCGWEPFVRSGEAWIAPCPFCDDGANNPAKQQKACRGFSVNLDHGGYHCLACGKSGVVTTLVKENGGTLDGGWSAGPTSDGYHGTTVQARKDVPEGLKPVRFYRSQWEMNPGGVEYAKGRGFNKESILAWGLGWDPGRNALAIPTINPQTGDPSRWKFRIKDHGSGPKYKVTPDCPQDLVGTHLFPSSPPFPPVTITEGELDAVALWQYGVRPVISIPSGASSEWRPEWVQALRQFGQIFLAMDNDEAGEEAVAKAVKALGAQRCKRVVLPRKDAGECLADGVPAADIHAAINEARPAWAPEGIQTMGDWVDGAIAWVRAEEKIEKVTTGIYDLDQCLGGGLAPGDLTFIYGKTSHGKSTLALSILVNALRSGVKCLSASLEYLDAHHARIIAGQVIGKHGFRVTADDMERARDTIASLPLVPVPSDYDYGGKGLIDLLGWASESGARLAVFDPLDHIMPINGNPNDYYGDAASFVRDLSQTARKLNTHVIVVCPVNKEGDLAGRNTLKHDAWNLLQVVRDESSGPDQATSDVQVIVHKARRTGYVGKSLDLIYLREGARIADRHDHEGKGIAF